MRLADLVAALDRVADPKLAEAWDNVGLLIGDPRREIARALITIDCTREVAEEAHARGCQLVVAYHPTIFTGLKRIAADGPVAFALEQRIAIYSPHTALDAAEGGTNDVLARVCGMQGARPIAPIAPGSPLGMGRIGEIAIERGALIERIRGALGIERLLVAGPTEGSATRCAVVAGAAGDFVFKAIAQGADVILTGEVRHHDALAAAAQGVTVICALHSQSERIALADYRARIAAEAPGIELLVSERDRDPFRIL